MYLKLELILVFDNVNDIASLGSVKLLRCSAGRAKSALKIMWLWRSRLDELRWITLVRLVGVSFVSNFIIYFPFLICRAGKWTIFQDISGYSQFLHIITYFQSLAWVTEDAVQMANRGRDICGCGCTCTCNVFLPTYEGTKANSRHRL